jgi:hypothetical protein
MRTLVLKQDVSRDRIADVLRTMGLREEPVEASEGVFWRIWVSRDEKSAVHYVDDSLTKVRNFSVRGMRRGALAKKLKSAFPIWERDALLKHASFLLMNGSEEDRQRVAMEVAAEMDEYDAASAGVLTAFLKIDDRSVRLAGARALRTRPWPTFRRTAEELVVDSDPEVAAVGKMLLERIKELHGEE